MSASVKGNRLLWVTPSLNAEGGKSAGNSERIPLHLQVPGEHTVAFKEGHLSHSFAHDQACEENWPPLHQLEGKLSPADMAKLGTLLSKYQVMVMMVTMVLVTKHWPSSFEQLYSRDCFTFCAWDSW